MASRLCEKYPNLFMWHCLNHRLELSVGDAVDEVTECQSCSKFSALFLFCVQSITKKLSRNFRSMQRIRKQFYKIGWILNVRLVVCSFRTVKAIRNSFQSLYTLFQTLSEIGRDTREKRKFKEDVVSRISFIGSSKTKKW